MSDLYFILEVLESDTKKIEEALIGDTLDLIKVNDGEYTTNKGSEKNPVIVKCYSFMERGYEEMLSVAKDIMNSRIPVSLHIECYSNEEPESHHGRLRKNGDFVIVCTHPAHEGKVDIAKVTEAYVLGQIDLLLKTLEENDNSWQAQAAILKQKQ